MKLYWGHCPGIPGSVKLCVNWLYMAVVVDPPSKALTAWKLRYSSPKGTPEFSTTRPVFLCILVSWFASFPRLVVSLWSWTYEFTWHLLWDVGSLLSNWEPREYPMLVVCQKNLIKQALASPAAPVLAELMSSRSSSNTLWTWGWITMSINFIPFPASFSLPRDLLALARCPKSLTYYQRLESGLDLEIHRHGFETSLVNHSLGYQRQFT